MWYRSSSRQVRRLMSILPGPVNALYGETVRAFGMQSVFVQSKFLAWTPVLLLLTSPDLVKTTNMQQSCYVVALSIGRWLICMFPS